MTRYSTRRFLAVLGPVLALLLLAPELGAEEEGAAPRSSIEVFEALAARVEIAVEQGRLAAATGAAAAGLAFDLERELIRRGAEIEVSRLEVMRFEGDSQREALDRLIAAVVARERTVIEQTRRLEGLTGLSAGALPIPGVSTAARDAPVPPRAPLEIVERPNGDDETEAGKPEADELKLRLTFEAEDTIDDPDP